MTGRLTGMVEDLTGRKVVNYQSQVLFDPDMSLEMFVFDSSGEHPAIEATLQDLAEDEEPGVLEDAPELEPPSRSGQAQQQP
jgi:hypothetical protein